MSIINLKLFNKSVVDKLTNCDKIILSSFKSEEPQYYLIMVSYMN